MPENSNQPKEYDAVLGSQTPLPVNAAVLGGLAGVKHRLASTSEEVRIAALSDALKYGQKGIEIITEIVKTETGAAQLAAWKLLWMRANQTGKKWLFKHLPSFSFDVITVNERGKEINRIPSSASFFPEDLGNGIFMEMVSIPGGTFLMGSPETERIRYNSETAHQVTVQPFFIGKYAVTQAQWKAVAALPQINKYLNPDPSHSKGANLPVEEVLWEDAMEFCARLTKKTGKIYRLPSEAEWEYACRAGTTTLFHFGDIITRSLANYEFNHGETTDVGSFPPNAFGLYDMHGNVWEWCADWDLNYRGAPSEGTMLESGGKNGYPLRRGGSCFSDLWDCRSAYRDGDEGVYRVNHFGFRVVCSSPWTL